MRLFALSILGLTFEVRLGEGSPENTPPPLLATDGTFHEAPSSSAPPPLMGFSLPSTRDPWPGWEE